MRRFYIASHGDFSKGIKHSLEMIAGHSAAAVHTYSLYPGESAVDFFGELKKKAEQAPEDEFILMGDLFAASVVTAMMGLTVLENVIVFSGVNLNLALELMLAGSEKLTDEKIQVIIRNARQGIQRVHIEEIENDDF